ncbi:hypothetical protein DBT_0107 [Dissulfuribacter thermophilus]|uniref:Uncharacterized protein n=1 Tax=Dissulfuribacter thermophilus TaxID=1156395 RepID=A0A1B9F8Q7_9BACT|nr:hypothetical protein DBT_0107 [Dissulfuribacter thermophilus]
MNVLQPDILIVFTGKAPLFSWRNDQLNYILILGLGPGL